MHSVRSIHYIYLLPQESTSLAVIKYSTFCSYYRQLLPHVVIAKPRIDLCWQCQQNSTTIVRSTNKFAEEKSLVVIAQLNILDIPFHFLKAITVAEEHINSVKQERAHYQQCCKTSSDNVKASFPVFPPPSCMLPANSTDTTVYYSFDMAQQVLIE